MAGETIVGSFGRDMRRIRMKISDYFSSLFRSTSHDFAPTPHHRSRGKRRLMWVLLAILAILIILILMGVISLSPQKDNLSLKADLKNCGEDLTMALTEYESLKEIYMATSENLSVCKNDLEIANSKLDDTKDSLTDTRSTTDNRISELERFNQELSERYIEVENRKNELVSIVKNSVRAVCCSFGDVQQAKTIEWDIKGNQIVCGSGEYEVNCGTGANDYPEK